jgi:hypothetical protein
MYGSKYCMNETSYGQSCIGVTKARPALSYQSANC